MQIMRDERQNFVEVMKSSSKESVFILRESIYELIFELICVFSTESVALTPLYCDLTVVKQDLPIIWFQPLCLLRTSIMVFFSERCVSYFSTKSGPPAPSPAAILAGPADPCIRLACLKFELTN